MKVVLFLLWMRFVILVSISQFTLMLCNASIKVDFIWPLSKALVWTCEKFVKAMYKAGEEHDQFFDRIEAGA